MELTMTNGFCEMNEMEMQAVEGGFSAEDFGEAIVVGAVTGGAGAAVVGGTATLGTMTVPAWVAGAVSGGLVGGIGYCVGELWNGLVG